MFKYLELHSFFQLEYINSYVNQVIMIVLSVADEDQRGISDREIQNQDFLECLETVKKNVPLFRIFCCSGQCGHSHLQ